MDISPKISNSNPYSNDPKAHEAVELLVEFMTSKVNPNFTREEAWEWYIENRPLVDQEDQAIKAKASNQV